MDLQGFTNILEIGHGKTVGNATGVTYYNNSEFTLVDIPGTYSLMSNSEEEEIARDYICFGNPDATVVILDATSLERNLNLVFQILEITDKVVVCVNLLDEAEKKGIHIDFKDTQAPSVKKVPSDFQAYQYSLCIVDTKASHANLTDDYAKIPEEMKKVAAFFKKNVLREVEEKEFFEQIPGLRSILGDRPVLRALHFFEEEKRVEKQPLEYGSAGSTFKRPEGYFAGKLIEDAGLRGYRVGDAQVSEKHCGFVINRGGATAAEVSQLMEDVTDRVEQKFGVRLEPEVKKIGEF